MKLAALDRKLLRDLRRIRGQALAIGAVIAVGVLLTVMMSGLVHSLAETRAAYYDRYRLADIFAPLARAPARVADELAAIDGVRTVHARITGRARINLPGRDVPVQGLAVSLPADGSRPALNDVHLDSGRLPLPARPDEILLLESLARTHGLSPGDRLDAVVGGARRNFRITGLARAPEFLFTSPPGEFAPDDSRFAVIWAGERSLGGAFDLEHAFNEALLAVSPGTEPRAVAQAVDLVLDRWGGRGAYRAGEHLSDRFIAEEIRGLRQSSATVPPLFLAVAAFLLNVVMTRIIQAEREQIGLLKAFGHANGEIGRHYFRMVLLIALAGAAAGCLGGIASGRRMVELYALHYKFPFLVFRLDPASFAIGIGVSVAAASAGGALALRRLFALQPAEAMRPPAPPDYSRSLRLSGRLAGGLDRLTRMVLPAIARQPLRFGASVAGIAAGMALSGATLMLFAAFDDVPERVFHVADRSDLTVTLTRPLGPEATTRLARMQGVGRVEGMRQVPAVFVNGNRRHRGGIEGLSAGARMVRAIDAGGRALRLPPGGLVLSRALARKLGAGTGDAVTVHVREGTRPTLRLPVAGIASAYLGAPAYMSRAALSRALGEGPRVNVLHAIAEGFSTDLYQIPAITDPPGLGLAAVAVLAVGAGLAAAFRPQPVLVDLATVRRGPILLEVAEDGRTRVRDPFVVTMPVAGSLALRLVTPGDRVQEGQSVLARIRPLNPAATDVRTREQALAAVQAAEAALRLARADVEAAEAERSYAEAELDRISRLAERGVASEAQLNQARRAAQVARAALARARAAVALRQAELAQARAQLIGLDDQRLAMAMGAGRPAVVDLVAPHSGTVLRSLAEEGATLSAGTPLFEIGDVPASLEVVAELLTQDAVAVRPGQRVRLDNWGGDGVLGGTVARMDPFAVTRVSALGVREQRVPVTIRFTDPPTARPPLGHGFALMVHIVTASREDVLRIPSSALLRDRHGLFVFVLREGRARRAPVDAGLDNGTAVEIRDGLSAGEQVVVYPPEGLRDGDRIAPRRLE